MYYMLLGLLLFSKYICCLFFDIGDLDMTSYADDNVALKKSYIIL